MDNWVSVFSRTTGKMYWRNKRTNATTWTCPLTEKNDTIAATYNSDSVNAYKEFDEKFFVLGTASSFQCDNPPFPHFRTFVPLPSIWSKPADTCRARTFMTQDTSTRIVLKTWTCAYHRIFRMPVTGDINWKIVSQTVSCLAERLGCFYWGRRNNRISIIQTLEVFARDTIGTSSKVWIKRIRKYD